VLVEPFLVDDGVAEALLQAASAAPRTITDAESPTVRPTFESEPILLFI
jgi:hypothetical protein